MQIAQPLIQSFSGHGYQVLEIDVDRDPGGIFNYACKLIDQRSMRPIGKVENSPKSSIINSNDKDKIDSYQKAKDEHDQRTLKRHTDILEATPDTVLDLEVYHHNEIIRITDDQEDRHSAFSLADDSNKEGVEDFHSSFIEEHPKPRMLRKNVSTDPEKGEQSF